MSATRKPAPSEVSAERERWEGYYRESAQQDFEREIYKRCAEEDAKREQ